MFVFGSCILVKSLRTDVWAKYYDKDLIVVVIRSEEEIEKTFVVCLVYFLDDEAVTEPKEFSNLMKNFEPEGLDLAGILPHTPYEFAWCTFWDQWVRDGEGDHVHLKKYV